MQHHEVGTAGQAEIDIRFDSLLRQADKLMLFKYVVKNVAWAHGKTATFMPKPVFGDNGSGMHVHQSLWKGGEPLFYDEKGYAGLSDMARWYIGGLLHHARGGARVHRTRRPTRTSGWCPGYEAPVNLVYSQRNRSASVRIPLYSQSPKAKRLEFRCPDPSCNPYLAFSAMLMAGLDGIQNRIEPPAPMDKDLYDLPPEELAKVPQVPGSLEEALDALEADQDFLKVGGVFTDDLIDTWIALQARERGRRPPPPPPPLGVPPLLRHLIRAIPGPADRTPLQGPPLVPSPSPSRNEVASTGRGHAIGDEFRGRPASGCVPVQARGRSSGLHSERPSADLRDDAGVQGQESCGLPDPSSVALSTCAVQALGVTGTCFPSHFELDAAADRQGSRGHVGEGRLHARRGEIG